MKRSTDVVIVGGGVIGCSIAYALRKRGIDVIVLDRGEIGAQASSAATGLLAPLKPFARKDHPFMALLLSSLALFPSLVPELEERSGVCLAFEQTGTLRIVRMKEMRRLQEWIGPWQQAGFQMELLTGDDLHLQEPLLASHITTALYNPKESQIDASRLVQAYARAATDLGATFYPQRAVIGVQHHRSKVLGITTSQGESITCHHLVIAAGAWAAQCGEWLGTVLPIGPLRGQSLSLRQPATPLRHILFGEGIYLAPKQNGTIVVGATREDVGFDTTTTPEGIAWLLDAVKKLVPTLECVVEMAWAGLRPKTPDAHPILGRVPHWDNVILAAGHTSFGVLLSAITAQAIAELVSTGDTPEIIRSFALERFNA
jgi:glycine oxidase